MLDTIAEDCGYLSIAYQLELLWGHVTRHANGLFFNSQFSEQALLSRYPDAKHLPRYTRLLPTKLSCYQKHQDATACEHVLIVGNHFAHKASDATASVLADAFPDIQFVVLGKHTAVHRNVRAYRSGELDGRLIESLYARASIIVLPSYVEGFGFGLVHALAARKAVVARDIPATREIVATYDQVSGLHLYSDDIELVRALRSAMSEDGSAVTSVAAQGWEEWVDGLAAFCKQLLATDRLFDCLVRRISSADLLGKALAYDALQEKDGKQHASDSIAANVAQDSSQIAIVDGFGREWRPIRTASELLALDSAEFICSAYVTLFRRLPEPDGLANYIEELNTGVSKLEIVSRLKNSAEGRRVSAPLAGYRQQLLRGRFTALLDAAGRSQRAARSLSAVGLRDNE
jgi:hypothetical protein